MAPTEKELRAIARKAKQRPYMNNRNIHPLTALKAFALIVVAAIAASASQLSLAPVYGEIPSSLYHEKLCTAIFWVAFAGKAVWRRIIPCRPSTLLPVVALYAPLILRTIFRFSERWGAELGPVVTEAATFYPLLFLSSLSAALLLEFGNGLMFDAIPAAIGYAIFAIANSIVPDAIRNNAGEAWVMTRCGLWHLTGGLYALLSPSLLLLGALPAVFHSASMNTMCVWSPAINETLAASNYSMIARTESTTGYVSVLENLDSGYRVLRCDHSLLGGEWQRAPKGFEYMEKDGSKFREPIYAVFVIMEAVRLVDPPPKNPKPRALAIGLGIGTSADALIRHGVETDIVELDPAVYRYAKEYFNLPANHTAYIEDAIGFVKRESAKTEEKKVYDYILHDVFTGGAVPAPLFTVEMFQGLHKLLADDGVIAINWAGDLKLKAARSIIETVQVVFNNCRVYREELPEDVEKESDFTNMVLFCTKARTDPITFRAPTDADFLGSFSRSRFLFPRYEIDLESYWARNKEENSGFTILTEQSIGELVGWQQKSAVGHWAVIRTVVPSGVWEVY